MGIRSQSNQAMRQRESGFTPKGSSPRVAPPFILRPRATPDFAVFKSNNDDFEAYVLYSVLGKIDSELARAKPLETIGLLAGRVMRDTEGPYTLVLACEDARGDETEATPGHVRITAHGHAKLRRRLELSAFGLDLVGWYHSHPTFPAQFSSVDTIEQSTLKDPHHVGIVASGIDHQKPYGVYKGPKGLLLAPLTPVRRPLNKFAKPIAANETAMSDLPTPQRESVSPIQIQQDLVVAGSAVQAPYVGHRRRNWAIPRQVLAGACVIAFGFAVWISLRVISVEKRLTALAEDGRRAAPQVSEATRQGVTPGPESRPPDAATTTDLPSNPKLPVTSSSPTPKTERHRTQRSARKAGTGSAGQRGGGSPRKTSRLTEPAATPTSMPAVSRNSVTS
jgi:proteasome lid subunit RPN8/RPN11